MKNWIFRVSVSIFMILFLIVGLVIYSELDRANVKSFTSKDDLITVNKNFKGVPIDQHGRYMNLEYPFLPSILGILQWQLSPNEQAKEKKLDKSQLKILNPSDFLNSSDDGVFWLGHASILIRVDKKNILIDPVFGNPSFIDRYFELPSPIDYFAKVDYVLTTHDHRDHLDEPTIRSIAEKFPDAKFLAGIGSENLLNEWTNSKSRVKTAGWYQQFAIDEDELKITFVPVRHWSRRGLTDTNERLWGGYIIEIGGKTFFHGGDSGYGNHYTEIAKIFPEVDYFIIGIGSYSPRWFMKVNHNNPEDAWKAFKDSKAKHLVPMHYATFDMTDEPPSEPLKRLLKAAEKDDAVDKVKTLQIYEYLELSE